RAAPCRGAALVLSRLLRRTGWAKASAPRGIRRCVPSQDHRQPWSVQGGPRLGIPADSKGLVWRAASRAGSRSRCSARTYALCCCATGAAFRLVAVFRDWDACLLRLIETEMASWRGEGAGMRRRSLWSFLIAGFFALVA